MPTKTPHILPKLLAIANLVAVSTLLLACSDSKATTPTSTPQIIGTLPPSSTPAQPGPTATAPVLTPTVPAVSTTPAAGAPAAPTNLKITGAIPDLHTPVPAGHGEQGRISVTWQDNSNNETGFRLYQDCGTVSTLTEVEANTTSVAPIQTCRPGRLGVAAFNAAGASAIVWSP